MLVASPRRDSVEEAAFFAAKLAEADIPVRALIVNRMHPTLRRRRSRGHRASGPDTLAGTDLGGLYANLADFRAGGGRRGGAPGRAGRPGRAGAGGAGAVPAQSDVHDLDGLDEIARHLFPGPALPIAPFLSDFGT